MLGDTGDAPSLGDACTSDGVEPALLKFFPIQPSFFPVTFYATLGISLYQIGVQSKYLFDDKQ